MKRINFELARSTEQEKQSQLERLAAFQQPRTEQAPETLGRLKAVALEGGNIFAELMETVRVCSLGPIKTACGLPPVGNHDSGAGRLLKYLKGDRSEKLAMASEPLQAKHKEIRLIGQAGNRWNNPRCTLKANYR